MRVVIRQKQRTALNETQIKRIERQFSVTLPASYRKFLKAPPSILAAALRQEDRENPGQTPLFLDCKYIVDANRMMRDPKHPQFFGFGPTDDPEPWPDQYFIVGSDVGGNFYCIKPATGTTTVYFWHQGDSVLKRCAKDLPAFIRQIFKSYGEFAAKECNEGG